MTIQPDRRLHRGAAGITLAQLNFLIIVNRKFVWSATRLLLNSAGYRSVHEAHMAHQDFVVATTPATGGFLLSVNR